MVALFICSACQRHRDVGLCGYLETQDYQLFIGNDHYLDGAGLLLCNDTDIAWPRNGALAYFLGRCTLTGLRNFMDVLP